MLFLNCAYCLVIFFQLHSNIFFGFASFFQTDIINFSFFMFNFSLTLYLWYSSLAQLYICICTYMIVSKKMVHISHLYMRIIQIKVVCCTSISCCFLLLSFDFCLMFIEYRGYYYILLLHSEI